MTVPPHALWQCHRPADFALKSWPDGVVLYDEADGSLHALNPVAGEAFGLLMAHGDLDVPALARLLVHDEPTDEDTELVLQVLQHFERLGLAQRVPL